MSWHSRFVPLVEITDTKPNMIKNHTSSAAKFLSLVFLFTLTSLIANAQLSTDAAVIAEGKSLFEANCKTCHRVKVN